MMKNTKTPYTPIITGMIAVLAFFHPVQAKTPNIDRLARSGMLFADAHCAAPACNPLRTAIIPEEK